MAIKIISALSSNYIIGSSGKIPWFIKGELGRFKKITLNHNVIMGRKTFDSIGKILEKRTNIIISKNENLKIENGLVVSNFNDALNACKPNRDTFIIGGSKIYEIALDYSQYLLLTIIDKKFEGDTSFPRFDKSKWHLIDETRNYDIENKFSYSYLTFKSQ
jgi:dihydrofolate reductase